jgi:hypothetical protein
VGESFLTHLDPQDQYDLTVDTFNDTLENCADKIIELMDYPEKCTTFKVLWPQRSK